MELTKELKKKKIFRIYSILLDAERPLFFSDICWLSGLSYYCVSTNLRVLEYFGIVEIKKNNNAYIVAIKDHSPFSSIRNIPANESNLPVHANYDDRKQ